MTHPAPEALPLGCPDEEPETQLPVWLFLNHRSDYFRVEKRERSIESVLHGVDRFENPEDFIGGGGIIGLRVGVEIVKP